VGRGGARNVPPTPVTTFTCSPFCPSLIQRGRVSGGGGCGRFRSVVVLLPLVLGELPVFDQQIKTGAAGVGWFVGPFIHAEFAIDEKFLALLNELAETFSKIAPYL
jgi:hypothetical protein